MTTGTGVADRPEGPGHSPEDHGRRPDHRHQSSKLETSLTPTP
jgi:hypothetical protein